jgi:hypothetical protein
MWGCRKVTGRGVLPNQDSQEKQKMMCANCGQPASHPHGDDAVCDQCCDKNCDYLEELYWRRLEMQMPQEMCSPDPADSAAPVAGDSTKAPRKGGDSGGKSQRFFFRW